MRSAARVFTPWKNWSSVMLIEVPGCSWVGNLLVTVFVPNTLSRFALNEIRLRPPSFSSYCANMSNWLKNGVRPSLLRPW